MRYVPSGILFARLRINGKLIRKSLKTSDLALGKRRLLALEKQERGRAKDRRNGKLTFNEALADFRALGYRSSTSRKQRPIKDRTRAYYEERIVKLFKEWPDLGERQIETIAEKECLQFADRIRQVMSASAYNHTIAILRHVLQIGIDNGCGYENPARKLGRTAEKPKRLQLPSHEQFEAFVSEVATSGSGFSKPCAELVQFLAFGGFRLNEAKHIEWRDCRFDKRTIAVRVTKNGQERVVPMIREMETLLRSMREARADEPETARVMRVHECQKSMNRAAQAVGMPRITHHDLRHLSATRCIESGVDIPTVSRWLGHLDGGALALRVYGHLRDDHSADMAKRVSFAKPANIVEMPTEQAI